MAIATFPERLGSNGALHGILALACLSRSLPARCSGVSCVPSLVCVSDKISDCFSCCLLAPLFVDDVLLYVHRNRRLIRDGSPGRLPRLSHSSWALLVCLTVTHTYTYSVIHSKSHTTGVVVGGKAKKKA